MQTNAVRSPGGRRRLTFHSTSLAALGEVYLLKGRPDDALPPAYRALDVGSQVLRMWQPGVGPAAPRRERHDTRPGIGCAGGGGSSRQALTLGEGLGMRPLRGPLSPRPWHPVCQMT